TPEVRAKLGLGLSNGELQILGKPTRVAKALMHIVNDIIEGNTTSRTTSKKEDRLDYANNLPADLVVPTQKGVSPKSATKNSARAKKKIRPKARDILIPDDCTLKITDARCSEIEGEL